ncbi:AsmA family protein, partial [Agrobacterium tumefaciens]|uniref:AsmA family protein n=3 Tax=Pseudomonadota TaxID=1224 RepID=UPI003BA2A6BC
VMDAGKLTLDPLNFAMAGGSMNTTIQLDGAKTPMTGRVKATARRLRLKQLFSTTESMQKSLGQMNGDVALTGTGNSVAALLGSSNGELKLIVNDGVISRSLMEIAGLNVGNYVISKLFGDDEVAINCGVTDAGIK